MSNEAPAPAAAATANATVAETTNSNATAATAQNQQANAASGTNATSVTPATPTPAAKVVPEKYDLKLSDGSPLDASHIEKISLYAKEKGFSQDEAAALLGREEAAVQGYADLQKSQFEATKTAWFESVKSDKELGGDNLQKNVELSKRVVTKFATKEFQQVLDQTGMGNHPEVVRVFARIGKAMAEDQLVMPGTTGSSGTKSMAETFYGSGTEAEAKT